MQRPFQRPLRALLILGIWPDEPLVREVGCVTRLGAQRSKGNPDVGRELGTLLHAAGFNDGFFTTVSEGWSTAETRVQAVARFRELGNQPGSIWAVPFGQAIGRKPT